MIKESFWLWGKPFIEIVYLPRGLLLNRLDNSSSYIVELDSFEFSSITVSPSLYRYWDKWIDLGPSIIELSSEKEHEELSISSDYIEVLCLVFCFYNFNFSAKPVFGRLLLLLELPSPPSLISPFWSSTFKAWRFPKELILRRFLFLTRKFLNDLSIGIFSLTIYTLLYSYIYLYSYIVNLISLKLDCFSKNL